MFHWMEWLAEIVENKTTSWLVGFQRHIEWIRLALVPLDLPLV